MYILTKLCIYVSVHAFILFTLRLHFVGSLTTYIIIMCDKFESTLLILLIVIYDIHMGAISVSQVYYLVFLSQLYGG